MTSFKVLAAAVILSSAAATPLFAQAAISEPGEYAFYHPNSDVGLGYSQPAENALASAPFRHRSHIARARTGSHSVVASAKAGGSGTLECFGDRTGGEG